MLYERTMTIRTIAVIGAGQMGAGIAQVAAQKELRVLLADASKERAEAGKANISRILGKLVEKAKLTREAADATLGRIEPIGSLEALSTADLAVEAATENEGLKMALFRDADRHLPKHAILASNTSSISITRLAAATSRPECVIGMHFMNPVPLMKLVEVIRGAQTSDQTYSDVLALAQHFDKTVVTSQDHPGFIVNRILIPMLNEACFALQEGVATAEDIDQGAKLGLNHPMGPLALADLIGLDTVLSIADVLYEGFHDSKYRAPTLLRNYVAAGWLGKKSGRGFYRYDSKPAG